MAVWFEKLVRQGLLMVGEHEIVFLHRLGYLHQEIVNHWGTDFKHFPCGCPASFKECRFDLSFLFIHWDDGTERTQFVASLHFM